MKVSVIMPALNEEELIGTVLKDLISRNIPDEVIVVDGGSRDRTAAVARSWAQVFSSEKGRARQMNTGAHRATGDVFLFLHADTMLPDKGIQHIRDAVQRGAEGGRFRMRFDDARGVLKFYQAYTRFHFFSYGDQGFFVTRRLFSKLHGFSEDTAFEDIDFYTRLRCHTRPVIIADPVTTSARRFRKVGCFRQRLINFFLVTLHYLGFNVGPLKRKFYADIR